jgi:hypothetical protein
VRRAATVLTASTLLAARTAVLAPTASAAGQVQQLTLPIAG